MSAPDLLVVGTGLIGTSLALAVRGAGWDVVLTDTSAEHLERAVVRDAGRRWDGRPVRLAVVAVPPQHTGPAVVDLVERGVAGTVSHVCSVQADVQRYVQDRTSAVSVCGGHPVAGREVAGPDAGRDDLFAGRAWMVCPSAVTAEASVQAVWELAEVCGAAPVRMSAEDHDTVVALVSHLPQLAASALAARLVDHGPAAAALGGPGLRDTTRIAASDPVLWEQILQLNGGRVAPLARAMAEDLLRVADDLEGPAGAGRVSDLLRRGNAGRALVPVKRGHAEGDFTTLSVSVPDRPGELARLLRDAAEAGVNVEDVRVEHIPGRPRGVIELLLPAGSRPVAAEQLLRRAWVVLDR